MKGVERYGLGPLVEIGWYHGVVAGFQIDLGPAAFRASGGYLPIILALASEDGAFDPTPTLEIIHSAQVNADMIAYLWTPTVRSRVGFSLGYHYNTALHHGMDLAFQGEAEVAEHVSVYATIGVAVYFRGDALARTALDRPDASFTVPFGAGVQVGGGAGLIFRP